MLATLYFDGTDFAIECVSEDSARRMPKLSAPENARLALREFGWVKTISHRHAASGYRLTICIETGEPVEPPTVADIEPTRQSRSKVAA